MTNKYLDYAIEPKKQLNMKMTVIPAIVGALRMIPKFSAKGMEELEIRTCADTIVTLALLRSARILKRVLETWGDLLSLTLQRKTISQHWCEKLARNKNIFIWFPIFQNSVLNISNRALCLMITLKRNCPSASAVDIVSTLFILRPGVVVFACVKETITLLI